MIISSSDIPDETRKISVGSDDMLVHAFSMMNRKSRGYVFLDQVRSRADGAIDMMIADTKRDKEPRPQFYIRGSISQLDSDVDVHEAGVGFGGESLTGARPGGFSRSRKMSVVSVDLHLVEYANRQVVPGASVSNSMVVVGNGWRGDASGVVEMSGLNLTFRIEQMESQSQAVRNLIELGLIELIGRHAGVPFERCLAMPETDPAVLVDQTRSFVATDADRRIKATRVALFVLGYLPGVGSSGEDAAYRRSLAAFQVDEHLIASGVLDPDTDAALRRRLAPVQAKSPIVAPD